MVSGKQYADDKGWILFKVIRGFQHVREGLEPFCDDIVKQQQADILEKVKQRHNLMTVECGQCDLRTLQPDHVHSKYQQCPLGQNYCNCQYPSRMVACPKNVCGAIYDEIVNLHASTPPCPNWKNTNVKHWCSQPWAIANCFINATGYTQKSTASEIDCSGLFHLLINNKGLQKHFHCMNTGMDVFYRVLQLRHTLVHSQNMELEDADVVAFIDAMIDILQDGKELKNRNESKYAVKKLLQLKQHDFINTASLEAQVKAEIEQKELNVKPEIEHKFPDIRSEVDRKGSVHKADIDQKGSGVLAGIDQKRSEVMAKIEQTRKNILLHRIYRKQCLESDEESRYTEIKKGNETTTSSDSHIDNVGYSDRYSTKHRQSVAEACSKNRPDGDDRTEVDDQEDTLLKEAPSVGEMVLKNEEPKASDEELNQADMTRAKLTSYITETSERQSSVIYQETDGSPGDLIPQDLPSVRKNMVCKQCLRKMSCVLFMPCKHICLCETCAVTEDECRICRSHIDEKIKFYRL